jgi:hypothetical protein
VHGAHPHKGPKTANRTSFKKGDPKPERSGRKPGVPNRMTADIKEAIVVACTMVAGKKKFDYTKVEGLTGYMARLAVDFPGHMAMLLRAALPLTRAAITSA